MLLRYTGCLLGAAIGDAMGMAGEGETPDLWRAGCAFRRAHRGHPNEGLSPGQYTDDTQLMLIPAGLLATRAFTLARYAGLLRDFYREDGFRFLDGSVAAACLHLAEGKPPTESGVNSTTAGCVPAAIPFALAYQDPVEIRETVARVASVTHTNPAAIAGSIGIAMLIRHALAGAPDALALVCAEIGREDALLGEKVRHALRMEKEGIAVEHALRVIGNDLSVYQTLPLSFFLMARFKGAEELLATAAHVGGNTDTIGLICGAFLGAGHGQDALPAHLLEGLEDRDRIGEIAGKLLDVATDIPRVL